MARLMTLLAFVIAALPASSVAYDNRTDTPVSVSVNLPDPKYSCGQLLAAASQRYHTNRFPKNSETIGKIFVAAMMLEAHGSHNDSFSDLTLQHLIQSYADLMGCFVSHRTAALTPSPSTTPTRIP